MNTDLNILIRHFFNRSHISELPEADIRQFISDHPYSAAGQILLAKKLQESGDESYVLQANASTLYVHDPLWLQLLLNEGKTHNGAGNVSDFQETSVGETNDELSTSSSENYFVENIVSDLAIDQPTNGADAQPSNDMVGEAISEQAFTPTHEIDAQTEPIIEATKPVSEQPAVSSQTGSNETESASDTSDAEAEIPVEPYYTVDYFASQGIKLQQAELGKDKLGQQLKSFTEWLRSMKRLPQATMESQVDPVTEQSINRIAEHSLEEKEVLTEAMAEVWKKQGNKERAIEIYRKLSLQNPAKSAYFAAKIEQLKS
jgi:hypothetical protein